MSKISSVPFGAAGELAVLSELPPRRTIERAVYATARDAGIGFVLDLEETIDAIHLDSGRKDHVAPFRGRIPKGLSFGSSREDVRSRLGEPTRSGSVSRGPLGEAPPWDRFSRPGYDIDFEYDRDCASVRMITLIRTRPAHR